MVHQERKVTAKFSVQRSRRRQCPITIKLINVRGLTSAKAVELQSLVQEGNGEGVSIMCMVETQQKYKKVDFNDKMVCIEKMREINDKKGGGISVIMHRKDKVELNQKECADPDIMRLEVNIGAILMNIIVIYVDCKENNRMERAYQNLNGEIQNTREEDCLVVLGDFNGHVGFLGKQRLDKRGQKVLDLLERWNLVLLNGDMNCTGEYTWVEGEHKSVIDFILVNQTI